MEGKQEQLDEIEAKTSNDFDIKLDSNINLNCLIGQEEAKKELKSIVHQLKYKTVYQFWGSCPPRGILLKGPPGVGKSFSIRCLAAEVDATLLELRYEDIATKWVDHQITLLKKFKSIVREKSKDKFVIIFFDEGDGFFPNRGADGVNESDRKRVNFFLEWLNGGLQDQTENVLFITATNFDGLIDPALTRPGRFERVIELKKLSKEDIRKALKVHYSIKESDTGRILVDHLIIDNIKLPASMTGAGVKSVVDISLRLKGEEHTNMLGSILEEQYLHNKDTGISKLDSDLGVLEGEKEFTPVNINTENLTKAIEEYEKIEGNKNVTKTKIGFRE